MNEEQMEGPTSVPLESEPANVPSRSEPVSEPIESEPINKPVESEPINNPVEIERDNAPLESEPINNPVESEPVNNPVESEPINNPVESEPVNNLVESEPVNNPVESEPINNPVESEPISGPIDSAIAATSIGTDEPVTIGMNNVDLADSNKSLEHINAENVEEETGSVQNSKDPFTLDPETTPITTETVASNEVENEPQININTTDPDSYFCIVQNIEEKRLCRICNKHKIVKYKCIYQNETSYICQDDCLYLLQKSTNRVVVHEYFTKFYCPVQMDSGFKFVRQCRQCGTSLKYVEGILSWEALDFCKESCLYRYQKWNNSNCTECKKPVAFTQLGKYGVRFGCIMRQFCSSQCLEAKKKKIRICSFCQKSIHRTKTTLGNKYFCHDICKGMYEHLQKPNRPPFLLNPDDAQCYVCKERKPLQIELDYHRSSLYFCTVGCFTIFKFVQNCDPPPKRCHTCSKYCLKQYLEKNALYYDNHIHLFCSITCQHIYIITHRRVVPCSWCKVKKYNFDMIQKSQFYNVTVHTCSLYCLNQLAVSLESLIAKRKTCYQCPNESGIYSLKLTDGTTQAFCSNKCINLYQTKFQASAAEISIPFKRTRRTRQVLPDKPGPLPVITSVCSLAPTAAKNKGFEVKLRKIIVIKSADLVEQRNVATSVCTLKCDKDTETDFKDASTESQSDIPEQRISITPILVPIYIPQPFPAWSAPVPIPLPFPLLIPCPILMPLTKNASIQILKEVTKKSPVKAPADPFEAELLMMAELVAAEKKDDVPAPVVETEDNATDEVYSPEPADVNNTFGEDMLQMALKMASDYEEEAPVDLEGALTANTITPSVHALQSDERQLIDNVDVINRQSMRGRRRGGGTKQTRQNPSRKARRSTNVDMVTPVDPEPVIMEVVEKPDAHMCLKYTFGVNAWKQWVQTKNAELERSSRNLKLFKTELLQLTSDELNYSLCFFVKEVRKPNGSEYAPDTIYYLCLGIQQFLYENSRIDNIFCDPYYEKFTDCLDEVCQKFAQLYTDSHYIVTRVEEEHLWESKQLGAHSPHVLLSTLMFFNTKHFNLINVAEHMQLSFSHIMKHWKRNQTPQGLPKQPGSRNVLLRFYPPQSTLDLNSRKKKVYEQQENEENPLRCPVKLYEFYLSKCPESVKTRNDVFYLLPERSCVPDSPVWYSTMALEKPALEKMLHRVKMVKEINVALLTN